MHYHCAQRVIREVFSGAAEGPEHRVETAAELVSRAVLRLSRGCPAPARAAAAQEALADLKPLVHEALEALEAIEGRRPLTDQEHSRRHSFVTLLCAPKE
jgi:hypothetical protein